MVAFSPRPLSQRQQSVRMSLPYMCLVSSLSDSSHNRNRKQIEIHSGTLPAGQDQTGLRFPSGVSLPVQKIQTVFTILVSTIQSPSMRSLNLQVEIGVGRGRPTEEKCHLASLSCAGSGPVTLEPAHSIHLCSPVQITERPLRWVLRGTPSPLRAGVHRAQ